MRTCSVLIVTAALLASACGEDADAPEPEETSAEVLLVEGAPPADLGPDAVPETLWLRRADGWQLIVTVACEVTPELWIASIRVRDETGTTQLAEKTWGKPLEVSDLPVTGRFSLAAEVEAVIIEVVDSRGRSWRTRESAS